MAKNNYEKNTTNIFSECIKNSNKNMKVRFLIDKIKNNKLHPLKCDEIESNKKQLVSPIVIKNNTIIKRSSSATPASSSSSSHGIKPNFSDYRIVRNDDDDIFKFTFKSINQTIDHDKENAINTSFIENSMDNNSELLDYSIVENTTVESMANNFKIKFRKSSKYKNTNLNKSFADQIKDDEKRERKIVVNDDVDVETENTENQNLINKNSLKKSEKLFDKKNLEIVDKPKNILKFSIKNNQIQNLQIDDIAEQLENVSLNQNCETTKENNKNEKIKNKNKLQTINNQIRNKLPCRENEFNNIYQFLKTQIQNRIGGCMYISGVPGTGKTETVKLVVKYLKNEMKLLNNLNVNEFNFIEINGMNFIESKQAYIQIYKQLYCDSIPPNKNNNKIITWQYALSMLEKRFNSLINPIQMMNVLLIDELDMLCNRRQDVIYNLLNWSVQANSNLIIITIANTMDLPERLLMGKISSRLGLTRLTFSPYTYQQLQMIVIAKLEKSKLFNDDAIQFVTRKVASVSGDARRVLNICKRSIEIYENEIHENTINNENFKVININHVQKALSEMMLSVKVQAIKKCSYYEKILLQSIEAEITRTGLEEVLFYNVYSQMKTITTFLKLLTPSTGNVLKMCAKLGAERLILCEHSKADLYQKISLNISVDDIHYGIKI